MTIAAVTFAIVLGVILVAYWLFVVRTEDEAQRTLRRRLRGDRDRVRLKARLDVVKATERLSSVGSIDRLLRRSTIVIRPLSRLIEEAGVRMTPGLFLLVTGACALAAFLVTRLYARWLVLAVIAAVVAGLGPYLYLRFARAKRLSKFEEQFPEAIDFIARALRAGHAFTTGLGMVAEEIPAPVASEFRLLYEQQNFGMPLPEALKHFAERVPLIDARFFVTAVLTQREAGGNLSEVLDNLAGVIRERFKVKRQVRVLSAHGRLTGGILVALPPVMAVVFFVMFPDTWGLLLTDPLGIRMVIVAIVLQIVGTLVIRKLVNIEY